MSGSPSGRYRGLAKAASIPDFDRLVGAGMPRDTAIDLFDITGSRWRSPRWPARPGAGNRSTLLVPLPESDLLA